MAPEWKKAATALKGVVKIGAVDMDVHGSVGGPYNVRGFPTIKIFGANKQSPKDYNGKFMPYILHYISYVTQYKNFFEALPSYYNLKLLLLQETWFFPFLAARSAQAIVDEALRTVQSVVKDRLSGRGGSRVSWSYSQFESSSQFA